MMRSRFLLLTALLLTAGAGCRNPFAQMPVPASPEKPIEETAPGAYRQVDARGFSFELKEGLVAFRDVEEGDLYTIDLGPTVSQEGKQSVPDLMLHVRFVPTSDYTIKNGCYLETGWNDVQNVPTFEGKKAGRSACMTEEADAGAGNRYNVRSYALPHRDGFIVFRFVVHSVACENYENPSRDCVAYDENRDFQSVESIVDSLRFEDGAWKGLSVTTQALEKKLAATEYSITYPEIVPKEQDAGLRRANELAQDAAKEFVASFETDAKDAADLDVEMAGPWTLFVGGSISHLSDVVVSTVFRGSVYTGGAHPNSIYKTVLVDRKTGKELALNDVLISPDLTPAKLAARVRAKLTKENAMQDLSDPAWIQGGTEPKPENYQFFGFTDEGLLIIFPPYQIAAYAAGPFEVVIPWSELKDLIKERFITGT